jgi:transcriptional regulator with XRE-family HTH domain
MGTPETAFGQQLRQLRLRAGLSQAALAERAGLAPKAIAALESGARRFPYPRTLGVLAEALGLSAAATPRTSPGGSPHPASAHVGRSHLPGQLAS